MLEETVEQYLRKRVNATDGEIRKVTWPGHRGAPDRLVGWPGNGRNALVELKRPKGRAEAHQLREHAKLKAIGLAVVILDSREAVDNFIAWMTR